MKTYAVQSVVRKPDGSASATLMVLVDAMNEEHAEAEGEKKCRLFAKTGSSFDTSVIQSYPLGTNSVTFPLDYGD